MISLREVPRGKVLDRGGRTLRAVVVLISLLLSVYVGWFWGAKKAEAEIAQGAPIFERHMAFGFTFGQGWSFLIKFVCPIVIIIMLIFQVSE